jgi:hypothetical protein
MKIEMTIVDELTSALILTRNGAGDIIPRTSAVLVLLSEDKIQEQRIERRCFIDGSALEKDE